MNDTNSQTFLDSIKGHLPSYLSAVFTGIFFVMTLVFNYSSRNTRMEDVQRDQERRLELLEKDSATRREVEAVKQTVDRIEDKLDSYRGEELKFHHTK
jgi:preprotein translocase subunit SecG